MDREEVLSGEAPFQLLDGFQQRCVVRDEDLNDPAGFSQFGWGFGKISFLFLRSVPNVDGKSFFPEIFGSARPDYAESDDSNVPFSAHKDR